MDKHLYFSLIPEALIASQLPPEKFGQYYATGYGYKSKGEALFIELDPTFRDPKTGRELQSLARQWLEATAEAHAALMTVDAFERAAAKERGVEMPRTAEELEAARRQLQADFRQSWQAAADAWRANTPGPGGHA